jgi:hypothetical protein
MSENKIDIPNLKKIHGMGKILIGIILILISIIIFEKNYVSTYVNLPQNISFDQGFLETLLSAISLIVGIFYVIIGILKIISAEPVDKPKDFNYKNLIYILRPSKTGKTGKINHSYSYDIAIKNIFFAMILVLTSGILAFFLEYLNTLNIFVTKTFIILLLIPFGICLIFMKMLIPPIPTEKKINYTPQDFIDGHPHKVYRILGDGLKEIMYERKCGNEPSLQNIGVNNTGITKGCMLMESQPEAIGGKHQNAAIFLFVCGGFYVVLGFFLLETMNQMIYIKVLPFPIAGAIVAFIGNYFIGKSNDLCDIVQFKSKIIFSDLKGEYYRSDLGVGTDIRDSLSSQRLSVISDFRLYHYPAEVTSECHSLREERKIVAINNSKEAVNDLNFLMNFMELQRKPDVEVQGIDFVKESAAKLIQQNIAIAKIKALEIGQSYPTKETSHINNLEFNGGYKEVEIFCSQCGTKNKGAKFCRNCGMKL